MPADQGPELLNAHFGTQSPHWRLAFDSNALELSAVKGKAHVAVALSAMEAAKIRRLTGVTASLELTITLAGEPLHLHLVGRRVNNLEWAGTASAFSDTLSVARDLVHGLLRRAGGVRSQLGDRDRRSARPHPTLQPAERGVHRAARTRSDRQKRFPAVYEPGRSRRFAAQHRRLLPQRLVL